MEDGASLLEHELINGIHVLRLRMPRLEAGTALLVLEDTLHGILDQGEGTAPKIVINLESIEYLVTTALAKLMSFRTRILTQGGSLCLCSLRPAVEEVLKITHFDRFFKIFEDEAAAISEMR